MPYSDAQNALDEVCIFTASTNLIGDLTDVPTSATQRWWFSVPFNCTITKLIGTYHAESAGSLTFQVQSTTTAIIKAAVTTPQVPVVSTTVESGQSLNRTKGEILNVAILANAATDDFTGAIVQVWATRRN